MATLEDLEAVEYWKDCPFVEIDPLKLGGTPILRNTRMPADAILDNHDDGMSAEEIARVYQLPAQGVRSLIAWESKRNPVEML